jgi:hypothetical protein
VRRNERNHCGRTWRGVGEAARGEAAGSDNPDDLASLAQGQQSRCGRLDQLLVIERAIGAWDAIEPLVGRAEECRQRREVGFLGNGIAAYQHAICAQTYRSRAMLRAAITRRGRR